MSSDALSVDWTGMFGYAYPPQILLHRVLQKAKREPCTLILIAPVAPLQSWFPTLLDLIIDLPRSLPNIPELLTQRNGLWVHPDPSNLKLAAWKISSIEKLRQTFLKRLKNISLKAEDLPPGTFTGQGKSCSIAGVVNDVLIQLLPL